MKKIPDQRVEEPRDPKEEKLENVIAISVVFVLLAFFGWWLFHTVNPSAPDDSGKRYVVPLGASPELGARNSTVVVIEFSDFECPYCGDFARDYFPIIEEQQIDTGRILFVYKHFPLTQIHSKALRAAEAAACAQNQDKFWEYHDLLYSHQDELEIGQLESYAQQLGLDMDAFSQCLLREEQKALVKADVQAGINAAVSGTPTFFFNGRKVSGLMTAEQFAAEVEKELSK